MDDSTAFLVGMVEGLVRHNIDSGFMTEEQAQEIARRAQLGALVGGGLDAGDRMQERMLECLRMKEPT